MAREMRGVNALEGPELGAIMAESMRTRQRNNTTTAQRAALLREMALQQPGPAGRGREEAAAAESAAGDEWWSNMRSMERMDQRRMAEDRARQSMANAPGRGLQEPYDWGTSQTGATQSEEDALMAQMAADAEQQRQANVSVDTAGTPGGFTTGENNYVQNLAQQEQFPQAFAGQGSSQFGGTELGMVPEGRRTEQGFSAENYIPGEKQVQEQDLVGKKIMEFLSGAGLKEGAQGDPNVVPETVPGKDPNVAGGTTSSGSSQFTTQHRFGAKDYDQSGQKQGGVVATGAGDDLSPQENQIIQQEIETLAAGRTDAGAVTGVATGDGSGSDFLPIGGIEGEVQAAGGAEQNAAIVQSLLSALEAAGVEANDLKMLDIDVNKFLSGVYNMADVDKLRIAARIAGVPANLRSRIQTMSDNVSGTSGRGFDWKDQKYDEAVGRTQADKYGRLQEEDFMDYTKRMHEGLYPSG